MQKIVNFSLCLLQAKFSIKVDLGNFLMFPSML